MSPHSHSLSPPCPHAFPVGPLTLKRPWGGVLAGAVLGSRLRSPPALPLQVKWIVSSVVELKRTIVPDYRNMIGQGA